MTMTSANAEWSANLPPSAQALPSLNGVPLRLSDIDAELAKHDDDFVEAMKKASAAIRSGFPLLDQTLKAAASTYAAQVSGVTYGADAAAKAVPNTGFGSPNERTATIASKRQGVFDQAWVRAIEDAAAAKQKKADGVAKAAVDAMSEAKKELDAALAKATGPITARLQMTMDRLSTIASLRDELRGYMPTAMGKQFQAVIAAGDEDAEDNWVLAAEPVLGDLAKLSTQKLGAALELPVTASTRNGGEIEKERAAIYALRRAIAARRDERMSDGLKVAPMLFEHLTSCFQTIFGYAPLALNRSEYERLYINASTPPAPLQIHPAWTTRALPKNAPRT
jgi:hypothetical protein